MLKEFRTFILRGNAIDLAVGVVIGAAFNTVVQSIVNGMLTPITALFGDLQLDQLSLEIGTTTVDGKTVPNEFLYGSVIEAMIQFVMIAAAIFFFVVKPMNLLRARTELKKEPVEETTRPCPECLTAIPRAARRCSACGVEVATA